METARKSIEIQAQVRHNADELRNTLNDLYSWQKDIKDKEKDIKKEKPIYQNQNELKTLPVRGLNFLKKEQSVNNMKSATLETSNNNKKKDLEKTNPITAKTDNRIESENVKDPHKIANEIKDRGNKLVKLEKYEQAIIEYTLAIQYYPKDAIYYSNRALCYLKLERYKECIDDCDRAIEMDKSAVKALYRRMLANESQGNNMDALKDCTTILMIEPKNSEARSSLNRINDRLRKTVKIEKGAQFSPTLPNMTEIELIDKLPHQRSTKPLVRIPIEEVIGPYITDSALKISDEDIDKIFNSNCGPYVEVKKATQNVPEELTKPSTPLVEKIKTTTTTTTTATITHSSDEKLDSSEKAEKPETVQKQKEEKKTETVHIDQLPPTPTTTAQFYSNWKELSPKQKIKFLKSIKPASFSKILGAGLDSYTLSDILQTINEFDVPLMSTYMVELIKNSQISILSMFMSKDDTIVLADILNRMKDSNMEIHQNAIPNIIKCFNFKSLFLRGSY